MTVSKLPIKLDFKRVKISTADIQKRIKDIKIPVTLGYTDEEGVAEALRCLGCGLCIEGCPDRLDIPGYIKAISKKDNEESVRIIFRDLPLPLICGYICTHLCEDACVYNDPVAIRHLKRFAAERVVDYGKVLKTVKKPQTNLKVAIIGAGPGGLTAAYYLAQYGVKCTIYEATSVPGGMLYLGIPKYRLPVEVIEKEVNFILSQGVNIKYNTKVEEKEFEYLMNNYDAIYIGGGTMAKRMTGIKGSDGKIVSHALDFLRLANLDQKVEIGKKVAVIGGGFTAMDSARTALRLGAEEVTVLYRRRAIDRPGYGTLNAKEEMEETEEEGVKFLWEVTPFEYVKENGKITGIKYWKNQMIEDGKRARPMPMKEKEYFLECDTIIEATGQTPDLSFLSKELLEKLNIKDEEIVVDAEGRTSIPKIFAGGDLVNKTKDFITAVADANRAVKGMVKFLGLKYEEIKKPEWDEACSEINESKQKNIPCTPY